MANDKKPPAMLGIEARSDPRVGSEVPVELVSRDFSGVIRAVTRDVSVGGVCVASPAVPGPLCGWQALQFVMNAVARCWS